MNEASGRGKDTLMATRLQDAPARTQSVDATIRTVLVHAQAGSSGEARLQTAVSLARKFDATVFGLAAEMIPPLGASDPTGVMDGAWYIEMRQQVQRDLELARTAFQQATSGVKNDFAWIQDMPADAIARASRAADLIVAGGCPLPEEDRYRACAAAEVMLRSGRPVLVAPPQGGAVGAEAVVVAWKDTREARRALADALPFLVRAETVVVLEVCGKDETADAELRTKSVLAGLQRHGVNGHARVVTAAPERVAGELNIAAEAIGADLIVAGGYGHTRLGEWFFGGVTRDLLHQTGRFVLLSH
jgi:nucleotide-binding universal stress UspA family protein